MDYQWSRFTSIAGYFGGAMLSAIKDWNDTVQMRVPGFRDRIVTVKLRSSEGGLNLKMGAEEIEPLVARGRAAGELLVKRFARPSDGTFSEPMDWDNHRWVRLRVLASSAQAYLQDLSHAYAGRQPGDAAYDELLASAEGRRDGPYPWEGGPTERRARTFTRSGAAYARWLRRRSMDYRAGAPSPQPQLLKRPRF